MIEALSDHYTLIKALHVISVIAWMAGLLYLPRLFVYHAQVEPGSETSELFKVMERRLYRAIMNPAMISALVFGTLLLLILDAWSEPWLHVKLTAIVLMMALHMAMGAWRRAFAEDRNRHPQKFFRWMNEGPTVLMIIIVVVVYLKPFGG